MCGIQSKTNPSCTGPARADDAIACAQTPPLETHTHTTARYDQPSTRVSPPVLTYSLCLEIACLLNGTAPPWMPLPQVTCRARKSWTASSATGSSSSLRAYSASRIKRSCRKRATRVVNAADVYFVHETLCINYRAQPTPNTELACTAGPSKTTLIKTRLLSGTPAGRRTSDTHTHTHTHTTGERQSAPGSLSAR